MLCSHALLKINDLLGLFVDVVAMWSSILEIYNLRYATSACFLLLLSGHKLLKEHAIRDVRHDCHFWFATINFISMFMNLQFVLYYLVVSYIFLVLVP